MTCTGTMVFIGFDFKRVSDGYLSCVFVDVGCYVSFADFGLCDAFLVAAMTLRVLELTLARPSLTMQTASRLYPMFCSCRVYIGGLGF
jgi:hypothetical protein